MRFNSILSIKKFCFDELKIFEILYDDKMERERERMNDLFGQNMVMVFDLLKKVSFQFDRIEIFSSLLRTRIDIGTSYVPRV